jgi:preprotein translocase subunit SecD
MPRSANLIILTAVLLFAAIAPAQAQLTMNAASDDAVAGWRKMDIDGRAVWVNPVPAITASDIQGAEPATDRNYGQFVKVIFTESGTRKMQELSTAQMNKLIAIVLDQKVIMAPKVRSVMSSDCIITGKPPGGLTTDEVRRILTAVNQKKPGA